MELSETSSLVALLQIIGIDIILSGDNALVIAMACRGLPREKRRRGIWLGTAAAMVLRIAFAAAIVYLLMVPFLKLAGSLMLLWIAIQLVAPGGEDDGDYEEHDGAGSLWTAIRIIVIADAVMSFDNVISVAAAARGHVGLLALGIAISIPLMVVGSQMMLWLLDRIPSLMIAGSALLGWIAGGLAMSDPFVDDALGHPGLLAHYLVSAGAAVLVVVIGQWLARREAASTAAR